MTLSYADGIWAVAVEGEVIGIVQHNTTPNEPPLIASIEYGNQRTFVGVFNSVKEAAECLEWMAGKLA